MLLEACGNAEHHFPARKRIYPENGEAKLQLSSNVVDDGWPALRIEDAIVDGADEF